MIRWCIAVILFFVFLAPLRTFADGYEEKAQAQIQLITHKIQYWQDHSEQMGSAARRTFEKDITSLQKEVDSAQSKLHALHGASQDQWKPLQKNLNRAMEKLRRAYRKTTAHFHS